MVFCEFQACADVEIDEFQNYDKAHGALMECLKFYERAEKSDVINSRLIQVSAFKEQYSPSMCKFYYLNTMPIRTVKGINLSCFEVSKRQWHCYPYFNNDLLVFPSEN